jgi:hypothetical protein
MQEIDNSLQIHDKRWQHRQIAVSTPEYGRDGVRRWR